MKKKMVKLKKIQMKLPKAIAGHQNKVIVSLMNVLEKRLKKRMPV
jgi:hypothetical protein